MGQIVSAKAAGIAGTSAYSQSNGLTPVRSDKKRGLYPSGIGPEMVLGFSPRTCAGGKPCPQVAGLNIRNTLQLLFTAETAEYAEFLITSLFSAVFALSAVNPLRPQKLLKPRIR